jgi:hypothetical protein
MTLLFELQPVDNPVDRWGYLTGIVDEHALREPVVWKPGDGWGRRCTSTSAPDLRIRSWLHNPQDRRRKRDLSARMTGDL